MNHWLIIVVLVFLSFSSAGVYAEEQAESVSDVPALNLTYYTEQLPPYNYEENGTSKGFTVDILKEISMKSGLTHSPGEIHVLPWDEAYQAALIGNNTGLFSTARTPDREDSFKWVGPISMEQYVLFALQDTNISVKNPADLKNLRIGATANDASIQLLKAIAVDESQFVMGTNASELITKLENKEIDLWASPEFTGRYYAKEATGDYYAFPVEYPLDEVGIYYAYSRDVPDSTIESLQKSLDAIKEEKDDAGISMYDTILGMYVPKPGTNSTSTPSTMSS